MNRESKNGGFIKLLIGIVLLIIILTYFGVDIKAFLQKPEIQKVIGLIADMARYAWKFGVEALSTTWDVIKSAIDSVPKS